MRVLGVIDRVVRGAFHCEVVIEIEMARLAALDEEIAHGVDTDVFHEVAMGDGFARALAHLHFLAVAVDADDLDEGGFEDVRGIAFHHEGALHAADVAVVVGAKNVD